MSKSSLDALFGSDAAKETAGIVVQYGPVRVRLARAGGANKKFATTFESKMAPYRRMVANDLLPDEVAQKILFETFAEAIVLEWSGITDDDGAEIPFSVENCVAQFTKYHAFFLFVQEESGKLKSYRTASAETDIKN